MNPKGKRERVLSEFFGVVPVQQFCTTQSFCKLRSLHLYHPYDASGVAHGSWEFMGARGTTHTAQEKQRIAQKHSLVRVHQVFCQASVLELGTQESHVQTYAWRKVMP